jgi:hypothetical protein
MKLVNLALVSVTLFGLVTVGCKKDDEEDNGTVDSSEQALISDDQEAAETDDNLEAGVDEPLSGATVADPGNPADGASDDEVAEKLRANPGLFFKPAGCLVSTRDGNKITHVFTGCTGPYGMKEFNGTITTTWQREPGKLTITNEADGFKINGATISGSRVVVYTRENAVITKTRTGNWSGTTAKGRAISHTANFVTAYDASTKCLTRDGNAQTEIGGRASARTIDGYKRCGIGLGGCPESGTLELSRTKKGDTTSVKIEFLGGPKYRVTGPKGGQITLPLVCNANAS